MKPLKFRLHFNRINMQRGDSRVWTVHNSHGCYQVENVDVRVPVTAVFKPQARQPRAYLTGKGYVELVGNTAIIKESC